MVFYRDLEANQWVVPGSGHHMKIKASDRLAAFLDGGKYDLVPLPSVPQDPLKFRDQKRYSDRLKEQRTKTGMEDAVLVATGKLYDRPVTVAVQDFDFMGGSLGMAAGSAVITGLEKAADTKTPFVLFASSGGARMQEGTLSLMQMPRTTVGVLRLRDAGLPFIVVFTNPTTGGVTASYAMLGDVHIAEPGALICFAGPRVIEQTIREKLPKGFQRSNISTSTAWSTWSSTATTSARPSARWWRCSPVRRLPPVSPKRRPRCRSRPSPMTTISKARSRRRRRSRGFTPPSFPRRRESRRSSRTSEDPVWIPPSRDDFGVFPVRPACPAPMRS